MSKFSDRHEHEIWNAIEKKFNMRFDDREVWVSRNRNLNIDRSYENEYFIFVFHDLFGITHSYKLLMSYNENTTELEIKEITKL